MTPASQGVAAGRRVGRYVVYEPIASGGMASVHFGQMLGPSGFARTVAIKRLHPQFARDPEFVSMFLDEARLAARILHPNVVSTLDIVTAADEVFLVMEYVNGEALSALLGGARASGAPAPQPVVGSILVGALHGLHAAHQATSDQGQPLEIVHRDVSPQNILVGEDGVTRIVDFGVAKAVWRAQSTRDGRIKGKISYMAPEQLRRTGVDRRTDLYAISVVLWEALAGRRLFVGDDPGSIVTQILEDEVLPPSRFASGIAPELDAFVMRGLARDAAKRFPTAADMAEELGRILPLARQNEVGDWVVSAAAQKLAYRATRLAAIKAGPFDAVTRVDAKDATLLTKSATRRLSEASTTLDVRAVHGDDSVSEVSHVSGVALPGEASGVAKLKDAPRSRSKARGPIAVVLVAVALASASLLVRTMRSHARAEASLASAHPSAAELVSAPGSRPSVIVLGIENHSADPVMDQTLDAVLGSALALSPALDSYAGSEAHHLAMDLGGESQPIDDDLARKLAQRDRVRVLAARGAVSSRGAGFALSVVAKDAVTGETVVSAQEDAPDGRGLVRAIGRAAWSIREALGEQRPSDVAAIEWTGASPSLEADNEWAMGKALSNAGRYPDACRHLAAAVQIDPEFVLAHAMYGVALNNQLSQADARREFELARRGIDRVGDRDRLRFLGNYYSAIGDDRQAALAYEEMLQRWPRDGAAETGLGSTYSQLQDWPRAIEATRRAAGDHPRWVIARGNVVFALLSSGDLEGAVREAHGVIADFPHPSPYVFAHLAFAEALLGHRKEAEAAMEAARPIDPWVAEDGLAALALFEGRVTANATMLASRLRGVDDPESLAFLWEYIARARLRAGDAAGAAAAADKTSAVRNTNDRFLIARSYAQAHKRRQALGVEAELSGSPSPRNVAYRNIIEGDVLRAAGDPRKAIEAYLAAQQSMDFWLGRYGLAQAYLDLQQFADARREFLVCIERRGEGAAAFTPGSLGDIPLALFGLARAEEGAGDPHALEAYRAYLSMQADDADDPLVEVARRKVAALGKSVE